MNLLTLIIGGLGFEQVKGSRLLEGFVGVATAFAPGAASAEQPLCAAGASRGEVIGRPAAAPNLAVTSLSFLQGTPFWSSFKGKPKGQPLSFFF